MNITRAPEPQCAFVSLLIYTFYSDVLKWMLVTSVICVCVCARLKGIHFPLYIQQGGSIRPNLKYTSNYILSLVDSSNCIIAFRIGIFWERLFLAKIPYRFVGVLGRAFKGFLWISLVVEYHRFSKHLTKALQRYKCDKAFCLKTADIFTASWMKFWLPWTLMNSAATTDRPNAHEKYMN